MLHRNASLAALLVLLAGSLSAPAQTIRTYAGGGTRDGQPATAAELYAAAALALDAGGALYVVDTGSNQVLRIGPDGRFTTLIGNGGRGFSGDGAPATRATLGRPRGVAVDTRGNVYVADTESDRIRRRDVETGFLTTFAGGGTPADGAGDGGPATGAAVYQPQQLVFDAQGNLYVGSSAGRVRRIDTSGVISTLAGTGQDGFAGDDGPATQAVFSRPVGVALAADGTLYISDAGNGRIRRVDATTRTVTTIAGTGAEEPLGDDGPATLATLRYPQDLVLSADGRYLFVSDTYHSRLRRIDLVEKTITTVAGNGGYGSQGDGGPATEAEVTYPTGLVRDAAGNLYVTSDVEPRVRKVTPGGTISTVAGTLYAAGDGGPATAALLRSPQGVTLDAAGNLLLADIAHQRIRGVDRATGVITTVAGNGRFFDYDYDPANLKPAAQSPIGYPSDLVPDGAGGFFIADVYAGRIYRVNASGQLEQYAGGGEQGLGDDGPATTANLNSPRGIALDRQGNLLIADMSNHRVRRVDAATRRITTIAGSGPSGYDQGGYAGDGGPATAARLNTPQAVRVDSAGNIYVSDTFNNALRVVTPDGRIQHVAGRGEFPDRSGDGGPASAAILYSPTGLAIDAADNVFVVERGNNRLRRIDGKTKIITTVAGRGPAGFTGDRGPATAARLNEPFGVAVAPDGTLYLADSGNDRIRIVPADAGCPLPTITVQPSSTTVVTGLSAILDVEAVGSGLAYQWYEGLTGDTSRPASGGTSRTLTTRPLSVTTSFWVRVTNSCGPADSDTASVVVAANLADLSIRMTAPQTVAAGGPIVWTISVRNDGPSAATGVLVVDTLPAGVPATAATASQGACSGTTTVSCALGSLVAGASASVTVRGTATASNGALFNQARVSANEPDPDPSNNATVEETRIADAGSADVYVYQDATPLPGRQGQDLTIAVFVENAGPATATSLRLTDTLPAGFTLVSASPSQGVCTGTGPVVCELIAMPARGSASVTLVVRPTSTGTFQNRATVTAAEPDPVPAGNTSSLDVEVRSNQPDCPPLIPQVVSSPDGVVRAGDSFSVTWSDVFGALDPSGVYRTVLATGSDFRPSSVVSDGRTRSLTASFPTAPNTAATYYFRVSAIAGCGQESAPSAFATITVAPNPASVVVTGEQSEEWVAVPGGSVPPATVRFKNVGAVSVPVTFFTRNNDGPGFFTFTPAAVNLAPGQEVTVTLTLLPGATDRAGVQGAYLTARFGSSEVSASVNLAVTDVLAEGVTATPDRDEVLLIGRRVPGRHPFVEAATDTVTVTNAGSVPIFLVPSVGPGGAWLVLDGREFSTPLPAGQTRELTLRSDPARLTAADFPLPIWTVLTISTAGGTAADYSQIKIFFTEAGLVVDGSGRGFLGAGESSFVIPTAVHRPGVGGTVFTSDGWIRNLSPDTASVDFYITPSGQDGQLQAQKVTQTIPGFSTLRLFDFVLGLFGSDTLAGPVEVRSRDFGQLSVRATANGLPGSGEAASRYGTEIPVFGSGTGTGVGQPPLVLTGIKSVPEGPGTRGFRLNVILSETLGAPATVRLRLYDSAGTELASNEVAVPPLGNTQLPLLSALGLPESTSVESGALVVEGVAGTGRVVAIGTLIDNASGSFQSLSGRLDPSRLVARRTALAVPTARVIPSIVHSRGAQGTFFTTEVSITNATAQPATLRLIYDYAGSVSGQATADVTVAPRASLSVGKSRDAVVNLFGLPPDSNTAGPMRIEGAGVTRIVARATVTTPVDPQNPASGIKGSEFQSYSSVSPEAVSRAGTPVTTYPGLQVYDGIRTNLILAEVSGQPARVRVRAINGTTGGVLGELEVGMNPWERLQINNVFGDAGFAFGDASFDRVSLSLEPSDSGSGAVVGAISVIDNVSASSRILVLSPPGPPGGSTIGF